VQIKSWSSKSAVSPSLVICVYVYVYVCLHLTETVRDTSRTQTLKANCRHPWKRQHWQRWQPWPSPPWPTRVSG